MVDTDVLLLLESGVAPLLPDFSPAEAAALASLSNNSLLSPCSAKGAGSTPRRVNRSARDAKQRRAPSDTCKHGEEHSSCETCILIHVHGVDFGRFNCSGKNKTTIIEGKFYHDMK